MFLYFAWSFKKKQRFPLLYTELFYLLSAVPLLHSVNTLAKARKCPNVGHSVFCKPSLKRVMSEPGQSPLTDFSSAVLVLSSDIHCHTFTDLRNHYISSFSCMLEIQTPKREKLKMPTENKKTCFCSVICLDLEVHISAQSFTFSQPQRCMLQVNMNLFYNPFASIT